MTGKQPLVSVLTLTYNHEPYIAQAVESVLMQKTDFPFELIIGEDCSTDGTRAIVDGYARKYPDIIRVVSGPRNVGSLANIERIYTASRGKYIATLEGDDYWNDELKLQKQVDFLERNPEYGLVHSDVNHYHQRSQLLEKEYNASRHFRIPEGDIFADLLDPDGYIIKTPTALFRKDLHDRHVDYGIIRDMGWVIADLFTWLSMAKFAKFKYIPEALATYRINEESSGNTADFVKKTKIHRSVFGIRFFFAEKFSVEKTILAKIKDRYVLTFLYDAFKTSDKMLAEEIVDYKRKQRLRFDYKKTLLLLGTRKRFFHSLLKPFLMKAK